MSDGRSLCYYRARYYNPAIGRFISDDPIGFRGGFNEYVYAADDPMDFNDPFGMDKNAPNNGSIKSPARQKCEAQAQQQFDATRARLNQRFWSQMKSSAVEGFVGGLIGGCLFTSEVGCFEGAVPGAVIGALSGASISTYHYIWNNGPQMTAARQQYEQQMQACMFE